LMFPSPKGTQLDPVKCGLPGLPQLRVGLGAFLPLCEALA